MVAASCLIQPNFDFQKTPMPLWADGGIVFGSGRSPHRDPLADLAHMGSQENWHVGSRPRAAETKYIPCYTRKREARIGAQGRVRTYRYLAGTSLVKGRAGVAASGQIWASFAPFAKGAFFSLGP